MGILPTSKQNETGVFQCLGHSNWTICIPLSHFCFQIFAYFHPSCLGAISYYPRGPIIRKGNSSNLKSWWDRGFSVPGAFKLDHLHPIKPLFPLRFSTFSLSYWEANSYYPRGPITGKGKSSNLKIGWDRGVSVPGAFKLDHLQPFQPILS